MGSIVPERIRLDVLENTKYVNLDDGEVTLKWVLLSHLPNFYGWSRRDPNAFAALSPEFQKKCNWSRNHALIKLGTQLEILLLPPEEKSKKALADLFTRALAILNPENQMGQYYIKAINEAFQLLGIEPSLAQTRMKS